MILYISIFVYAIAMTLANLSIAKWGVWVSPINAFIFIGLDLALRDWLHTKLKIYEMLSLITVSGLLTYAFNSGAGMIAVASAVSFTVAAVADWLTFLKITGSWAKKSNISNVVGAAVDSLVFPTLAFGVLMPQIVAVQFVAKIVGGAMWAFLFNYERKRH
jgi:queuosine precursor transporter